MDLSSALDEQRSFIERQIGMPALLAAGPGTGKTWVLERRSEFLTKTGVDPEDIAILTLTRSLAAELSERIPHGTASTLHSFALRRLNMLGDAWGQIVVDPWEQRTIVREDLALGHQISFGSTCSLTSVDKFLTKLGASFRDDQELPADLSPAEDRLRQVFLEQRALFGYRLMDELAYDLVRLIEAGAELERVPTHLLIDEYQDLTAGELRLLQLLQERCGAVVSAAGDDRQSIYGFREADSRALHRFTEVYGIDEPDYLWRSKRCPRVICDLANLVAAGLPPLPGLERPHLEPWPGRQEQGSIEVTSYPGPKAEARAVVALCQELLDNGVRATDVIIVVAAYHGPVFSALTEVASETGSEGLFFDPRSRQPEVSIEMRLAATCARLLINARDQMAWRTLVWAVPGFGQSRRTRILEADGATYLHRLRHMADRDGITARALLAGDRVLDLFGESDELDLREVVEVAATALRLSLDPDSVQSLGDTPVRPAEVVQRLFESEEAAGEEEIVSEPGAVAVHTVFSAKGLQAPHVFLVNAVNESFAGRGDAADGLRMAYVSVTRASSALHISGSRYLRYTALGKQMGVDSTRVADFLVDHCIRLGVELRAVQSS